MISFPINNYSAIMSFYSHSHLQCVTFTPFQNSLHVNKTMPRYFTLLLSYIIGHEMPILHLNDGHPVLRMVIIHSIMYTGSFRHGCLVLHSHVIFHKVSRGLPQAFMTDMLSWISANTFTQCVTVQGRGRPNAPQQTWL